MLMILRSGNDYTNWIDDIAQSLKDEDGRYEVIERVLVDRVHANNHELLCL